MKAIILVSSIFYILGLKISNKIDLIKSTSKIEKVSVKEMAPVKSENTIEFNKAKELTVAKDSVIGGGQSSSEILEYK